MLDVQNELTVLECCTRSVLVWLEAVVLSAISERLLEPEMSRRKGTTLPFWAVRLAFQRPSTESAPVAEPAARTRRAGWQDKCGRLAFL